MSNEGTKDSVNEPEPETEKKGRRAYPKEIKTKEPKEEKPIFRTVRRVVYEDFLLGESIFRNNTFEGSFLCHNSNGIWFIASKFSSKPIYVPPQIADLSDSLPYRFTDEQISYLVNGGSTKDILPIWNYLPEVIDTISPFLDIERPKLVLIGNSIIGTYLQDKFNSLGYLFLVGPHGSGKTQVLELFRYLGYRGHLEPGLTSANIYDLIGREWIEGEGTCTILDDEAQELNLKDSREKLTIYRSGYKKGAVIRRIMDSNTRARQAINYKTYNFKVFAGRYMPRDQPFCSRCIPITTFYGYPQKDEFEKEDIKQFQILKNKLLLSRLVHYFEPLPIPVLPKNLFNRDKEIWKSQLITAFETPYYSAISALADDYVKEEIDESKQSVEAVLAKVLMELVRIKTQGGFDKPTVPFLFSEIWAKLMFEMSGKLPSEGERAFFSKDSYRVSTTLVGSILKTMFGGKKGVTMDELHLRNYAFEIAKIETIAKHYIEAS